MRGADFIIAVVSAGGSDPIRTIFYDTLNEYCSFLMTGQQTALKAGAVHCKAHSVLAGFMQVRQRFLSYMLLLDTCIGSEQTKNKVFGLTR